MRTLIVALLFLAVPVVVTAQQADAPVNFNAPSVELQQSTPAAPATAETAETERGVDRDVEVQTQKAADDAAALQDPTQARWWWLVGAIVVAGILLAALL